MSEDTSARGDDAPESETDASTDETADLEQGSKSKSVSHHSYRKAVEEAKRERAQKREIEAKLKEFEDQRLSEAGNKDELIKSLRTKLDAESKRTKELYGSFARKSLGSQLKGAALDAGCIDPEAVMSLADLSALEVDANSFEADPDEVKDIINGLKKSKPYLFQKAGPKLNAKLPNGTAVSGGVPDFNGMKTEEIQAFLKSLAK